MKKWNENKNENKLITEITGITDIFRLTPFSTKNNNNNTQFTIYILTTSDIIL